MVDLEVYLFKVKRISSSLIFFLTFSFTGSYFVWSTLLSEYFNNVLRTDCLLGYNSIYFADWHILPDLNSTGWSTRVSGVLQPAEIMSGKELRNCQIKTVIPVKMLNVQDYHIYHKRSISYFN